MEQAEAITGFSAPVHRALTELAVVKGLGPTGDYVLTPAGEP